MGQLELWTRAVYQTDTLPSAISVEMNYRNLPYFFARALGKQNFTLSSHAVAMYQPRDIMVVLDFSASMNDDSEFGSINRFGKDAIMAGLEQCTRNLARRCMGIWSSTLNTSSSKALIPPTIRAQDLVEYRGGQVYVESSKDLSNVVIQYSNGYTYKYDNLSCGETGTFGNGNTISKVWVKSGQNASGVDQAMANFDFSDFRDSREDKRLELHDVRYPYESGSWDSFIDYCRSNSTNRNAGFQYHTGLCQFDQLLAGTKTGGRPDGRSVDGQRSAGHGG